MTGNAWPGPVDLGPWEVVITPTAPGYEVYIARGALAYGRRFCFTLLGARRSGARQLQRQQRRDAAIARRRAAISAPSGSKGAGS